MPVAITTESAADLSEYLTEKFDITVIPMNIIADSCQYKDGETINPETLLQKENIKTSAVSIGEYEQIFAALKEKGFDIVHIALSSKISSTHQNAAAAAKIFKGVYVVDSLNLSAGMGLLCVYASQMAKNGKSAEEIAKELETLRNKVYTSFILENLEQMKKGGRCSAVEALGANILKIKPCIELVGGKLMASKKYRGKSSVARDKYILDRLSLYDAKKEVCFLNHSIGDKSEIDRIKSQLKTKYGFSEVYVNTAGCCITAHCGRDCMGIIFEKAD